MVSLLLQRDDFSCTSIPCCVYECVTLTEQAKLHWVPGSTVLSLAFVVAFTTGLLFFLPLFLLLQSPQPTHCWLHMRRCPLMHACTQPSNTYKHTNIHVHAAELLLGRLEEATYFWDKNMSSISDSRCRVKVWLCSPSGLDSCLEASSKPWVSHSCIPVGKNSIKFSHMLPHRLYIQTVLTPIIIHHILWTWSLCFYNTYYFLHIMLNRLLILNVYNVLLLLIHVSAFNRTLDKVISIMS